MYIFICILFLSINIIWWRYKTYNTPQSFVTVPYTHGWDLDIRKPHIIRDMLFPFSHISILYFKKKYGSRSVYILHSPDPLCSVRDSSLKRMLLGEYIDNYLLKGEREYYLKYEDTHQFLREIGLEGEIYKYFRDKIPNHYTFYTSFWMGPKGSTTTFHYDTDHSNYLCVLEGKKRIYMVRPGVELKRIETCYGDYWSDYDIRDKKKLSDDKNIVEIMVNKGEILNIPRNIWHAVENMENTVSFTFHYCTLESFVFNISLSKKY